MILIQSKDNKKSKDSKKIQKYLLSNFVRISFIYIIYSYFILKIFVKYLIGYTVFLMYYYYYDGNVYIRHKCYRGYEQLKKEDSKGIGNGIEAPFLEYRKNILELQVFGFRHMLNCREQRHIRDLAEILFRGYHIITDHLAYHSDLQLFEFSFRFSKTNLKVLKIILFFLKLGMLLHRLSLLFKYVFYGTIFEFLEEILYLSVDFLYYYSLKAKKDLKIYIISGQIFKDLIKFLKGSPYWVQKIVRFLTIELVDLRTTIILLDKFVATPIFFCYYLLFCFYELFIIAIPNHLKLDGEQFRKNYIAAVIQAKFVRIVFYKFVGILLRLTLALNLFWITIHIYYTFERLYYDLFKYYIDILIDIFFIIFG